MVPLDFATNSSQQSRDVVVDQGELGNDRTFGVEGVLLILGKVVGVPGLHITQILHSDKFAEMKLTT